MGLSLFRAIFVINTRTTHDTTHLVQYEQREEVLERPLFHFHGVPSGVGHVSPSFRVFFIVLLRVFFVSSGSSSS